MKMNHSSSAQIDRNCQPSVMENQTAQEAAQCWNLFVFPEIQSNNQSRKASFNEHAVGRQLIPSTYDILENFQFRLAKSNN